MYNNKSSAVIAMQETLMSIQKIRNILASESHNLSREAYAEMEQRLGDLQSGLSQAIVDYSAYQCTQAPHLYEDDEEEKVNFWRRFVAWTYQGR